MAITNFWHKPVKLKERIDSIARAEVLPQETIPVPVQMLPKDLLNDLEKGDRTLEFMAVNLEADNYINQSHRGMVLGLQAQRLSGNLAGSAFPYSQLAALQQQFRPGGLI